MDARMNIDARTVMGGKNRNIIQTVTSLLLVSMETNVTNLIAHTITQKKIGDNLFNSFSKSSLKLELLHSLLITICRF